jgi:polar amino acid transport system substrate-binding protein
MKAKRDRFKRWLLGAASLALAAMAVPISSLSLPQTAVMAAPMQAQVSAPVSQSTDDDWARVKAAGKLLVGTSADYAPFEFYNSNYQFDGFDIALMNEIGKRLSVTVEFNDFAFEGVLSALQLKQVDAAIAGISVTPDRREKVDFSNLYYIGEDAALVGTSFKGDITAPADMAGKKIGVERGTTYQAWVQQNLVDQGLVNQADLLTYDSTDTLVRDLRAGKVDIALMGLLPAQQYDRRLRDIRVAGSKFTEQKFAIAARKGSTLIQQFNSALLQIQSDGTFSNLVAQYLQVEPDEVTPDISESAVVNQPATTSPTNTAPACVYGMAFVADLNLDDKNMTAPPILKLGQQFSKGWRLRNSGTCDWGADFQLAYAYGNRPEARMGGSVVPVGKAVKPGETIDLSANLTAPNIYGVFQGFWNMRDANNQRFGEVVWVGIQIPNPNPPPTPAPPPPPPRPNQPSSGPINPNLRADSVWISVGQCTNIRWDIDNVNGVFFIDGGNLQGVAGHDVRNVCPRNTTNYTLRIIRRDNVTQDFYITINVTGGQYQINFWADSTNITVGQCTTVRWDVNNVNAVYFQGNGVPGQGSQQVCPGGTTSYNLKVILNDGRQEDRQVTVTVGGFAPSPTAMP